MWGVLGSFIVTVGALTLLLGVPQPYDVAIEDENDMLMAMCENLGAEKSGATITEEEHGFLNGES